MCSIRRFISLPQLYIEVLEYPVQSARKFTRNFNTIIIHIALSIEKLDLQYLYLKLVVSAKWEII